MFYQLIYFSDGGDFFNLFRYITFRSGGAFFTALIFGFVFGQPLINLLKRTQGQGQPIRDDGPERHLKDKKGTPTMGGVLILGALIVSTLLWAKLSNPYIWIVLFVTFSFGLIGFFDDYQKVKKQNVNGISGLIRLILGLIIAAIGGYAASQFHPGELQNTIALPILKNLLLDIGIFFIPFS
ncbi:MAG: phospho-N-acetylmuramoyl-pentapeptide-transferase, partial [Paracoccaceae bacterium]|nr:phospho-N-acetylmuramoyl-pentapeptide-transferase [Paracoccaceae bacterium]